MAKEWDMRLNGPSLLYAFRRFLQFSTAEMRAMVMSILIMTFIVAFNDGSDSFSLTFWSLNYLRWLLIVTVSFSVFVLGQRLASIYDGYIPEYRIWWYGLMFGLIVSFVSRGYIWLLLPGGMYFHMNTIMRTGEFRHGTNVELFSKLSLFGPFAALAIAMLIKTPEVWFGYSIISPDFVRDFFVFNMWLAAFSLLPIPPLPGSKILFHSRVVYALIAGSFIGYAVLVLFNVYSMFYAFLVGVVFWALALIFVEQKGWEF